MPIYEFESEDGLTREEYFPALSAPKIGETVVLDGMPWTRKPSVGSVGAKREIKFTSQQIAPWHPDAPHHDPTGLAQFQSRREIREFEAKTGHKYDQL